MGTQNKILRENLTDLKIQNMRPEKRHVATNGKKVVTPLLAGERLEVWDNDVKQMYLRVSHTGRKTFLLLSRVKGSTKQSRYTLGQYLDPKAREAIPSAFNPIEETPFLTLAQARDKARTYLNMMRSGKTPLKGKDAKLDAVKKQEIAKRTENARLENSFSKVRDRFLAAKAPLPDGGDAPISKGKPKQGGKRLRHTTYGEYKRLLNEACLKDWAGAPIDSITRREIRVALETVEQEVSHIAAHKLFAVLRTLFNWAVKQDILETNPMAGMEPPEGAEARDRVLTDDELAVVYKCLDATGIFAAPYRLLALTGQRLKEITKLELNEVNSLDGDAPYIELSAARTKNKLPHVVPLAPMAVDLLRDALEKRIDAPSCSFVFTTNKKTPISGFSKCKKFLDAAIKNHMEELKKVARKNKDKKEMDRLNQMFATPWRIHDLRRTVVTGMNSAGILPHVVEAVVNHISGPAKAGVAGVYNKALYLPERRQVLCSWADHITRLTNPEAKPAKVVPLRTANTYKKK